MLYKLSKETVHPTGLKEEKYIIFPPGQVSKLKLANKNVTQNYLSLSLFVKPTVKPSTENFQAQTQVASLMKILSSYIISIQGNYLRCRHTETFIKSISARRHYFEGTLKTELVVSLL